MNVNSTNHHWHHPLNSIVEPLLRPLEDQLCSTMMKIFVFCLTMEKLRYYLQSLVVHEFDEDEDVVVMWMSIVRCSMSKLVTENVEE